MGKKRNIEEEKPKVKRSLMEIMIAKNYMQRVKDFLSYIRDLAQMVLDEFKKGNGENKDIVEGLLQIVGTCDKIRVGICTDVAYMGAIYTYEEAKNRNDELHQFIFDYEVGFDCDEPKDSDVYLIMTPVGLKDDTTISRVVSHEFVHALIKLFPSSWKKGYEALFRLCMGYLLTAKEENSTYVREEDFCEAMENLAGVVASIMDKTALPN